MRIITFIVSLMSVSALSVGQCEPPASELIPLEAYLRYLNGLGANREYTRHFSVIHIGGATALRDDDNEPPFDPALRLVYVLPKSSGLNQISCPAAEFENCVRDSLHLPAVQEPPSKTQEPCRMTVRVQRWSPSPNDERKKLLAAELLKELEDFGYSRPRFVYVRDFNLDDPEIDFYVVTASGMRVSQGCDFVQRALPHCGWHLYGQSPLAALRKMVVTRPYRLYPPPMGLVPSKK